MPKILVVEDDKEINRLLCDFLESQSYEAIGVENGMAALSVFKGMPDISLILLDIMLPMKSGDSVLADIRDISDIPVIILSAKDTTRTKIDVIRMGADDYITKPFDLDEVLVRIEAVLRRSGKVKSAGGKKLKFRDLELDTVAKTVMLKGISIALTGKEYGILELMMRNPNKLFSKANLFESVWEEPYYNSDTTLKVHMSNLRNKLRQSGEGDYIETIYGMGYRMKKS